MFGFLLPSPPPPSHWNSILTPSFRPSFLPALPPLLPPASRNRSSSKEAKTARKVRKYVAKKNTDGKCGWLYDEQYCKCPDCKEVVPDELLLICERVGCGGMHHVGCPEEKSAPAVVPADNVTWVHASCRPLQNITAVADFTFSRYACLHPPSSHPPISGMQQRQHSSLCATHPDPF